MTAETISPQPVAVARQALRRLTESGLPPTPDHYAEHYYLIAGELTGQRPEPLLPAATPEAEVTAAMDMVLQILTDTTFGLTAELGTFDGHFQNLINEKHAPTQAPGFSMEQALGQIMKTISQLRQRVADSQAELRETQQLLQRMQDELKESRTLAQVDPLTGVLNRRGLDIILTREFTRTRRQKDQMSIGMIDIDLFKHINDTYGHDAGDQALVHLVMAARGLLRPQDIFARMGGEEFVAIFPGGNASGATFVLDRLRALLDRIPLRYKGKAIPVRISAGVAQMHPGDTVSDLMRRADRCLYKAKDSGRNLVINETDLA
ncbi:diguanylate cyclase [Methylocaldum sp.]|uniref:GGDEF domain-containing protein n=1 Tax=Methylocaldum sp. TaxID=1969727 RepID=UPI002D6F8014|nr:diguanylate cyclase [Methylocaldum sp.]HYE33954.1 diguanylate cyclase [Methylocaldum sp.]